MAEAEEEIGKKRKIRAGHRSAATKLANKIKLKLDDGSAAEDKQWIKQSLQSLKEKVESLKGLDNQIVELHGNWDISNFEFGFRVDNRLWRHFP